MAVIYFGKKEPRRGGFLLSCMENSHFHSLPLFEVLVVCERGKEIEMYAYSFTIERANVAMKIRGKVIVAVGVLLSIIIGLTVANNVLTNQMREDYGGLMDSQEITYLLKSTQYRITGISNDERGYLLTGKEEYLNEIGSKADDVKGYFSKFESMLPEKEGEDHVVKIKEKFTNFLSSSERVQEAYRSGKKEEALAMHFGMERETRKALDDDVKAYVDESEKKTADVLALMEENEKMKMVVRWVIVTLAILFGLVIGVMLYRSIVKPIRKVNLQMREIAEGEGDLTKELQVKSKDEIGELSHSFNRMLANLRELISQVRSNAEMVTASSEEMSASAEETSKATEQIAHAIQSVAQGTEKQLFHVESSTRKIHELSATVQQIAGSAETVTSTALQAAEMAVAGNLGMQTAVTQVGAVHQTMSQLAEVVEGLDQRSQEIGQIVEVSTSIAAQINLLALNAAIEAARAGEHGRGFSVVADEVRKLAEQSSQSSRQIASLIAAIQGETSMAVATMDNGKQEVTEGIQLVTEAGEIFAEIQRSVNEVAHQIRAVSASSRLMAEGTGQAVEAIAAITEVTATVSAETQEVSAATEEQLASMEEVSGYSRALSKRAEELQALIGKFTV